MTWEDIINDYPNAAKALLDDFNNSKNSSERFNNFVDMIEHLQEPGETHIRRTLHNLNKNEMERFNI